MNRPVQQRLDRRVLERILQAADVTALSGSELTGLFEAELGGMPFLPDGVYQLDPRNGERILFNASRSRRPHDHASPRSSIPGATTEPACVICEGRTTGVVDVAALSEGFTFINKNLYPILYPARPCRFDDPLKRPSACPTSRSRPACGLHFIQWTSSWHHRDWHNMPVSDLEIVVGRLAALEQALLFNGWGAESDRELEQNGMDRRPQGFVSIVKNYGCLVGCSIAHGHQQIACSNVAPRRIWDNRRFEEAHGEVFSSYLMRENPAELVIRDYGPAVLLVPYFMRRSYDMMLLIRDFDKGYLYQLSGAELGAVAKGWRDAIRAMHRIMPGLGREIAYNVVTHNGPGAGLYFEFLPYTQESGGFEHLGLYICQADARDAARCLREDLESEAD
ncbi:MAG TPA: hypothetical protein ENN99_13115 [Chloroflexi bacterium]|nr:hypothetical protein [Chloroflexota bacterium]